MKCQLIIIIVYTLKEVSFLDYVRMNGFPPVNQDSGLRATEKDY
jgi:hypothetical protein